MSNIYDKNTKKWFRNNINSQTTVCKCDKCGLFYKPLLGHSCNRKQQYDIIYIRKEVDEYGRI